MIAEMVGRRFNVRRPCMCQLCQKIGRGERIRTSDPHNPIVVRYQAALRPDRLHCNAHDPGARQGGHDTGENSALKVIISGAES